MSLLLARAARNHRGGGAVPAYRYIRLYITANNGDASYTGIGEIEMALSSGGANVCTGGMASASSQFNTATGPTGASAACGFDSIIGSSNGWVTAAGSATPSWICYDFGVGNAKDIREIRLFNQLNQYTRVPKDLIVQGSNDGSSFVDIRSFSGLTGWVNNTPKVLGIQ